MTRLTMTWRRWIAASVLVFAPLFPAFAENLGDGDSAAIQSVIEGQIQAFRADDGEAAYSYAAPSIKRMFPNPDIFMSMVRQGYQPVFRPRSYAFSPTREVNGVILQEVAVIGPKGQPWTALYTLERQADGMWKITGCQLFKPKGADA